MINKNNWEETKKHFIMWWQGEDISRPMMRILSNDNEIPFEGRYRDYQDKHIGLKYRCGEFMHRANQLKYHCEAYPYIDINIGPGSLATYLGSKPHFAESTVWYEPCIKDYNSFKMKYDSENYWLKKHLDIIKSAKDLAKDDFLIAIPDIVENMDILAAMRDPQTLLMDMYDYPETVKKFVDDVDNTYFDVYNRFYDIVKDKDGSSCFTAFAIWGPGKTAKIQCDFCAMISPKHFRDFVLPGLSKQCDNLDYSMYHLDGRECFQHVPAIMEIESLNALQWTPGAAAPDAGSVDWFPMYKKVRDAEKSLWLSINDGSYDDWIISAKRIINEFGSAGIYLHFPTMTQEQALRIVDLSYKW